MDIEIIPEPVPSSRRVLPCRFSLRTASTNVSVSGRGTRTSGVTIKLFFQKPFFPVV